MRRQWGLGVLMYDLPLPGGDGLGGTALAGAPATFGVGCLNSGTIGGKFLRG